MKRVIFILSLTVLVSSAKSQVKSKSPKEEKLVTAEYLFKEKQYREALYEIKKVIKTDSTIAKAFNIQGNCYSQVNQLDSAEISYKKALFIDKNYSSPYFNLGSYYLDKENYKEAVWFLKAFNQLEEKDSDGFVMLAQAYSGLDKKDSAAICYEQALKLDPSNIYVLNHFGWNAFHQDQFDKATEIAIRGMKIDSVTDNFYQLGFFSAMEFKKYREAESYANEAIKVFPDKTANYYFRAKAAILSETPEETFKANSGYFKDLHSFNTTKMDEWVRDPAGKYYFQTLVTKFRQNPDSLGLDEYFMMYYGKALQEGFSSMAESDKSKNELFEKKDYTGCIKVCMNEIENDPTNMDSYFYAAISNYELKNFKEYGKFISIYHYFMTSLVSSGDGKSFETAFIVTKVRDEYNILQYIGLQSTSQSLHHKDAHSFDILHAQDENENKQDVYFNIDKHWESLSKAFGSFDSKEKKEKKRKKKKVQE